MAIYRLILCFTFFFTLSSFAGSRSELINGVKVESNKEGITRFYLGTTAKTIAFPLAIVKKGITNFTEKCNNAYKTKRKFSDAKVDCKYHNDNFIESFVISDLKNNEKKTAGELEKFLVGRQVYNRGRYGYYELVQVQEHINENKKKVQTITLTMLEDSEVSKFIEPKFKKDSSFSKSSAKYTLTETSANETALTYEFSAATDHWILNKEVSVSQVFASISKNINDLMVTVMAEAESQNREIASHP